MITWALIASAVIALVLVVLVQGKWTNRDSWFAALFSGLGISSDMAAPSRWPGCV